MLDLEQLYDEVGANYDLDATREGAPFGHRTKSTRECTGSESIKSPSCDLLDSVALSAKTGRARFEHATDGLRVRRSP